VPEVVPSSSSQRACYRGSSRRWHALWRLSDRACLLALALAVGGCSFSYQLDNMVTRMDDTASLRAAAPKSIADKPVPEVPAEGDLAIARAAVSEVLASGGKDTSMPWENPQTGARGTITPLASAYGQDGLTCRDLLASYVLNGSEAWLQGEACRAARGRWEVRNLRPWNST
jgi:hypothetical protein